MNKVRHRQPLRWEPQRGTLLDFLYQHRGKLSNPERRFICRHRAEIQAAPEYQADDSRILALCILARRRQILLTPQANNVIDSTTMRERTQALRMIYGTQPDDVVLAEARRELRNQRRKRNVRQR